MGYWEKIAEHIATVVEERKIENVLHFTLLEDLPSILEYGLLTRSQGAHSNAVRLDEEDNAVSVSISCYYPRMFEYKRDLEGNKPFVILVLSPRLLWEYHCLFYRYSVLDKATKYEHGQRYGGYALQRIFDDCSIHLHPKGAGFRGKYGLPESWPTFSESEVQVMSRIAPEYIRGAWIEAPDHADFARAAFNSAGREDCEVVVHPFKRRIGCNPYWWG